MGECAEKLWNEAAYPVASECCKEKALAELFSCFSNKLSAHLSDEGNEKAQAILSTLYADAKCCLKQEVCESKESCTEAPAEATSA